MTEKFTYERPETRLDLNLIGVAYKIVEVAQKIGPRVCKLPGNEGTQGFMIGITKNKPNSPILTVQIGTIEIADNLYGLNGAIAVGRNNEYIISTTAFKNLKMDTAVSLGMAVGAGLISMDKAEEMAHDPKLDCVREFMAGIEDILEEEVLH